MPNLASDWSVKFWSLWSSVSLVIASEEVEKKAFDKIKRL
jgi:hypothetical protein